MTVLLGQDGGRANCTITWCPEDFTYAQILTMINDPNTVYVLMDTEDAGNFLTEVEQLCTLNSCTYETKEALGKTVRNARWLLDSVKLHKLGYPLSKIPLTHDLKPIQ